MLMIESAKLEWVSVHPKWMTKITMAFFLRLWKQMETKVKEIEIGKIFKEIDLKCAGNRHCDILFKLVTNPST